MALVFLGSLGFLGAFGSLADPPPDVEDDGAGLLLALRLARAAKSVSSSSPAPDTWPLASEAAGEGAGDLVGGGGGASDAAGGGVSAWACW